MKLLEKICNANIKEDKIWYDIINLAPNTTLKAKISEVKNKISSIADLAIITVLTPVENKITNVSNIVKKHWL